MYRFIWCSVYIIIRLHIDNPGKLHFIFVCQMYWNFMSTISRSPFQQGSGRKKIIRLHIDNAKNHSPMFIDWIEQIYDIHHGQSTIKLYSLFMHWGSLLSANRKRTKGNGWNRNKTNRNETKLNINKQIKIKQNKWNESLFFFEYVQFFNSNLKVGHVAECFFVYSILQ